VLRRAAPAATRHDTASGEQPSAGKSRAGEDCPPQQVTSGQLTNFSPVKVWLYSLKVSFVFGA
jgi:hypothetical protein